MTAPVKLNYKLYQGSTFREVVRWESATKVYVPISQITKTAPMVVTAPNHGAPALWRVKITGATGMKEANTLDYITNSATDTNTLTFNQINAINYNTYISGGVLEYNQPVDLTGYTARMQIREKLTSDVVLQELTTTNGKIVLNNTTKTIQFLLTAVETAALNFNTAVYSLELASSGGEVTQLLTGTLTLVKEVTR